MTSTMAMFRPPLLHPYARVGLFLAAYLASQILFVNITLQLNFELLAALTDTRGSIGDLAGTHSSHSMVIGEWLLAETALLCIPLIAVLAAFCAWLDRRPFHTIGIALSRRGNLQFAAGLLLGISMVWLNLGLLGATGHVASSRWVAGVSWPLLLLCLLGFWIQSAGEELVARGYLMQNLLTGCRIEWAVAAQAIIFAMLHSGNPGGISLLAIINLLLFATGCGLAYLRLGSLWLVIGVHTGWNFCLANIAGLVVSGVSLSTHVFETRLSGAALWTGGEFGLEASLVNTLVWSFFCATFALMPVRYTTLTWWERARHFMQFGNVVVETSDQVGASPAVMSGAVTKEASPPPETDNA